MPYLFLSLMVLIFSSCSTAVVTEMGPGLSQRPSNTTCLASGGPPPSVNLGQTGCFQSDNPQEPASGLIPYGVNTPLWSDGALKDRWMALPDGSQIEVTPEGDWVFPVGTVMVKNFTVDDQLIETRLFMHQEADTWAGFTYEWNEAQTEATLVPGVGKIRPLANGQTWQYPSRTQCLLCHTQVAGRTLGPETAQMNRSLLYPSTGITANQISTLQAIGLLAQELGDPESLPRFFPLYESFPGPTEMEQAARDYLHTNCSICHRPGGPGGGPEDLRVSTPLADMNACDEFPTLDDFGIPDARILAPGDPDRSTMLFRMETLMDGRMPPLATSIVDPTGTTIVREWISSLTSCE